MSAEEREAVQTRHYPGRSRQQVLDAAVRLWRLSDGDDYRIEATGDGLVASRKWSSFAQMVTFAGTDTWTLHVVEHDGASTARMSVATVSRGTSASLMGMMPTAHTGPNVGRTVEGTAIHDVFWARMDHLLGLRTDWMRCEDADRRVAAGITRGNNDALCNGFNLKDAAP